MKLFLFGLIAFAMLTILYFYRGRLLSGSAHHSSSARNVADVHDIALKLEINGSTSLLFILLSADGSINRSGSGTLENRSRDFFIGIIDPAIFKTVRSHLTETMLQGLGQSFQRQSARGAPCKLTLVLKFNDGTEGGSEYLYGAESEGPPSDVVSFVRAAVRETDAWYQQQLRMVSGSSN